MGFFVDKDQGSLNTVAGTASATIHGKMAMCKQIFVKAATVTTTFDLSLTDIYNNITWKATSVTDEHNQFIEMPCYGNWTLTISNASADEEFKFVFGLFEPT